MRFHQKMPPKVSAADLRQVWVKIVRNLGGSVTARQRMAHWRLKGHRAGGDCELGEFASIDFGFLGVTILRLRIGSPPSFPSKSATRQTA